MRRCTSHSANIVAATIPKPVKARCRASASIGNPSLGLLDQAGVIVNDAPAFWKALPNQRETSADIALRARQMPMPEYQRGILAEKVKFKPGKIKLAHRRAVGIIFLVARHHAIPSAGNAAASGKC